MPADPTGTPVDTLSFEDALTMLQDVVLQLESGDLTLDETIERFKKGSELASRCQRLIAEAELRITELAVDSDDTRPNDDGEPAFLHQAPLS